MVALFRVARQTGSWVAARLNVKSERGATAVEYGLMVALIAAVIIVAVVALGRNSKDAFCTTADAIGQDAAGTACPAPAP